MVTYGQIRLRTVRPARVLQKHHIITTGRVWLHALLLLPFGNSYNSHNTRTDKPDYVRRVVRLIYLLLKTEYVPRIVVPRSVTGTRVYKVVQPLNRTPHP